MIENIVIGNPKINIRELINDDSLDNTFFTEERWLPKILKELNLIPSTSWLKKNKPEYFRGLNDIDCFYIKLGKSKKPIYIVIGE